MLQEIKAKADKSKDGEEEEDEVPEPVPASPPPAPLVRMAYLSVIGGHTVNGVAEIHSEIVKDDVSNWPRLSCQMCCAAEYRTLARFFDHKRRLASIRQGLSTGSLAFLLPFIQSELSHQQRDMTIS